MRIVFISEWFSENMGYTENLLPKAIAALGHEVHVVSSTAQIYFSSPSYHETYEPFLGPPIVEKGVKDIDGFRLHRLPLVRTEGMPGISGLQECLEQLNPDIVQTFDPYSDSTFDAAQVCKRGNSKLFTASHVHASVFRKEEFASTWKGVIRDWLGRDAFQQKLRFIAGQTVRCYPIAPDAAQIAIRYFKVPKAKICVQSLGVDQQLFYLPSPDESKNLRKEMSAELGFHQDALVCIYTGRLARDKNPQCLADAIHHLRGRGENVVGIFVGNGTESEKTDILEKQCCYWKPFVPARELRGYYWLADIVVWPAQESTSQLDAMACGLPLILSNKIEVLERIQGNGLLYEEGDALDLADKILQLKDEALRKKMRETGVRKIQTKYSWETIARARITDYSSTL